MELPSLCLQYYVVRWCNSTSRSPYCSPYTVPWKSVNVTGGRTQFTIHGYAGDTFSICARVVTTYGPGLQRSTCIRRIVPLLDLKVPYAWASKTGRYGLQMTVQWDKPKVSEHLVSNTLLEPFSIECQNIIPVCFGFG